MKPLTEEELLSLQFLNPDDWPKPFQVLHTALLAHKMKEALEFYAEDPLGDYAREVLKLWDTEELTDKDYDKITKEIYRIPDDRDHNWETPTEMAKRDAILEKK